MPSFSDGQSIMECDCVTWIVCRTAYHTGLSSALEQRWVDMLHQDLVARLHHNQTQEKWRQHFSKANPAKRGKPRKRRRRRKSWWTLGELEEFGTGTTDEKWRSFITFYSLEVPLSTPYVKQGTAKEFPKGSFVAPFNILSNMISSFFLWCTREAR